ncbi:MarR family winged helix-turn-helix transcriptional regulator [Streptomyces sp. NPDC057654]|uniref:MarR family winged helix-turn-helix transcriptional regulator n=1 Tax=Streptomyces sp. NPDC057654 TaxID=3346196 RepID=UPI0036C269A5
MPVEELPSRPPVLLNLPVFALSRLGNVLRGAVKDAFEKEALSWREHLVLLCVKEYAELSQRELAGLMSMDASDLVKVLDGMERAGRLRRRPAPNDRRRHLLSITADGDEVLQRGRRILDRATARSLAPLNSDERRNLHQLVLRALDSKN